MQKLPELNSIDELVAEASKNALRDDKYEIKVIHARAWNDTVAGKRWEEDYPWGGYAWKEPKANTERAANKPAEHDVYTYTLEKFDGSRYSRHTYGYTLSKELFDVIDAIWTKRPAYRGASYNENKGYLTLNGIIKRLGIDNREEVKTAKQKAEDEKLARARDYQKCEIKRALEAVSKAIWDAKDLELPGFDFNALAEYVGMEVK